MAASHESEGTLGRAARQKKGWWASHRWLLLRRLSQLSILLLFLVGPWFGLWIVKGNLSFSLTLDWLPLTDPHLLAQMLAAGQAPEAKALLGALLVVLFYLLVGGRLFCSWVCPVNPITDAARWLRQRLGLKGAAGMSRSTRFWMLGLTLALPLATGALVWELVNPVSMAHRGLIFGMGAGWMVLLGVFLFDLLVMRDGWCGRLCPVGAFYSLLGHRSLLRVAAAGRGRCNDCMECYAICPEPQVIRPALKGAGKVGPVIDAAQCTNCGRCIDICSEGVFRFGPRWAGEETGSPAGSSLPRPATHP